uniref:Uncharacterized protein n=1 Tax=Picea sitchensis TaxID=3332 RepID=A9NTM1_PICSI|nr:unknown [Picea sitchensis]
MKDLHLARLISFPKELRDYQASMSVLGLEERGSSQSGIVRKV